MRQVAEARFFSVYGYSGFADADNDLIEAEIRHMQTWDDGSLISNRGGWQSNPMDASSIPLIPGTAVVAKTLLSLCTDIYHRWGIQRPEAQIGNFWFNVNGNRDFNIPHAHPLSTLSAVYYVRTPPNCGRIIFERPDTQEAYFIPDRQNPNEFTNETWHYEPEPGLFVVFPSYLRHYVDQNMSNEDRISIAFNFN